MNSACLSDGPKPATRGFRARKSKVCKWNTIVYSLHQCCACMFVSKILARISLPPTLIPYLCFPKQWSHLQWVKDLLVPGCFLFIKSIQGVCTEEGGGHYQTSAHFHCEASTIKMTSSCALELLKVVLIMKLNMEFIYKVSFCHSSIALPCDQHTLSPSS